jgi:hypothetical protein
MQVTASTNDVFEPPVTVDGLNTVVVRDQHGNPIFAAVQQDDQNIWAMTADNPRFADVVENLGISARKAVKGSLSVEETVDDVC